MEKRNKLNVRADKKKITKETKIKIKKIKIK